MIQAPGHKFAQELVKLCAAFPIRIFLEYDRAQQPYNSHKLMAYLDTRATHNLITWEKLCELGKEESLVGRQAYVTYGNGERERAHGTVRLYYRAAGNPEYYPAEFLVVDKLPVPVILGVEKAIMHILKEFAQKIMDVAAGFTVPSIEAEFNQLTCELGPLDADEQEWRRQETEMKEKEGKEKLLEKIKEEARKRSMLYAGEGSSKRNRSTYSRRRV